MWSNQPNRIWDIMMVDLAHNQCRKSWYNLLTDRLWWFQMPSQPWKVVPPFSKVSGWVETTSLFVFRQVLPSWNQTWQWEIPPWWWIFSFEPPFIEGFPGQPCSRSVVPCRKLRRRRNRAAWDIPSPAVTSRSVSVRPGRCSKGMKSQKLNGGRQLEMIQKNAYHISLISCC